jgi:nitrite reductase (NADH) small subunit
MTWIEVAEVSELGPKKTKLIPYKDQQIGLYLISGKPYAILNFCPHFGAPLCLGTVTGAVTSDAPGSQGYDAERNVIRCPWHRWEFDMDTGAALAPIKQRIKTFPAEIRENSVWIMVK